MSESAGRPDFEIPLDPGPAIRVAPATIVAVCGGNDSGLGTVLAAVTDRVGRQHKNDPARVAVLSARSGVAGGFDLIENVFLGSVPMRRLGPIPIGVDSTRMRTEATRVLGDLGVALPLSTKGDQLGELDRLRVELARALVGGASLLVIDEPSAVLDDADSETFFTLLATLRDRGTAFVVLTQKPRQALDYADEVVVLNRHRLVARHPRTEWASDTAPTHATLLHELFAAPGNPSPPTAADPAFLTPPAPASLPVPASAPAVPAAPTPPSPPALASAPAGTLGAAGGRRGGVLLAVRGWSARDVLRAERLVVEDASFELGEGELLGIAGLRRSGAEDLLLSVYGRSAGVDATGEVSVRGAVVQTDTIEHAIAAGLFFAGTSQQRYRMHLLGGLTVPVSQTRVRGLASLGLLSEATDAPDEGDRSAGAKLLGRVRSLSREGDQGARVLGLLEAFPASDRQVLFLIEPFDGASAAERDAILTALAPALAGGKGAVLVASDTELLLQNCDRVLTMAEGRITGVLPRGASLAEAAPLLAPS
ncbi:hypothetical protein ACEXQD_05750 [Herbiconiux sp. P15]|uniref:hypothetical protein n=1 Tax=Herbiconiux liukaitaii TaxID=3342799 RepID=UPI0035B8F2F4